MAPFSTVGIASQPRPQPAQNSRLLNLPLEILDMIFDYAVTEDKALCSRYLPGYYRPSTANFFHNTELNMESLALTCHNILDILLSRSTFYKNNDFSFRDLSHILKYLDFLRPEQRASIRSITTTYDYYSHGFHMIADECVRLRRLTIDISGSYEDFEDSDEYLFRLNEDFLSIRGLTEFEITYNPLFDEKVLKSRGLANTKWNRGSLRKEMDRFQDKIGKILKQPRLRITARDSSIPSVSA